MAKEQGLSLTGPLGLLKQLTKTVIETALEEEMTEHLGYERRDVATKQAANSRNGTRAKTVLTETTGPVEIEVPRDREGSFVPIIVKKRQRRLNGVDEMVLVSGHPVTRPDRDRQDPMDNALEARFERICHHFQ